MNRLTSLVIAASLALGIGAVGARAQQAPKVEVQALRGSLHLLQGGGGNVVASVGFDGILLIDDDYPQYAPAYEEAIAKLAGAGLAPGFVVNTHWHGDHTGNNEYWGNRGAIIFGHNNVRKRMSSGQRIEALDMQVEPSPAMALPMVTYGDSLALHFNGNDIEVQHYPAGHTDGDSVIYYAQDNVVHTGDLFFRDAFPFIDLSSGGSVAGYIANVEAVLARLDDDTLVVPGHGALAGKADLQRFLDMLKQTTASIHGALDAGKSVDQVIAAGLGEQWRSWGTGFIDEAAWIRTVAAGR
ncbi:MAG: MBL fold metallo-hydrolase [Halioglobus sp.]|nr:MBL fold metallo-hydrolase [Halioglobus sp.]|tara:strand:- start:814 stop:1707 length:894 start_codon:yes stop_codon:yes gene_type:complete